MRRTDIKQGILMSELLWITVKDFGAIGDGIHDDTAAIQSAIDYATAHVAPVNPNAEYTTTNVYFPNGDYRITSQINIIYKSGIHFYGEPWGTRFLVDAPMTSAFHMDGVGYCVFENFQIWIVSGGSVTSAVNMEWDVLIAPVRTTIQNEFRNILIKTDGTGTFVYGFSLGLTAATAIDGNVFTKCAVLGGWTTGNTTTFQAGYRLGNGTPSNNLNHFFYACDSHDCRYFIDAQRVSFHVFGAEPVNGEACFNISPWQNSSIHGVNVEGYERFLVHQNASYTAQYLTVSDCLMRGNKLNADGIWIDILENGIIRLANMNIQGVGSIVPRVRINTYKGLVVEWEGLIQPTPYVDGIIYTAPALTTLNMRGYVEIDSSLIPIAVIPTGLGTELVTNGGFETGNPPTGWLTYGATPPTITQVTDNRPLSTGTKAINALSTGVGGIYRAVSFVSGHKYLVSFWAKNTDLEAGIYISLLLDTFAEITGTSNTVTAISWTNKELVYNCAENASYIAIQPIGTAGKSGRIDDISVREII
jgi:hypothetical protein